MAFWKKHNKLSSEIKYRFEIISLEIIIYGYDCS